MLAGPAAEDDGDAGLAVLGHRADPTGGRAPYPRSHERAPYLVPRHHRRHRRPTAARAGPAAERADHDGVDVRRGGDLEYGRYGNPTWTAFEEALGALEGGRCLAFASGMAAVATVLDLVGQGENVVAPRHAYNGTVVQLADLEARGRLDRALVDITDTDAVVAACEDAALVWLESPTNPALEVADIPRSSRRPPTTPAPASWSTTPSPPRCCSGPSTLGADLVLHSATKYLAGHSRRRCSARSSPATTSCTPCSKGRRDLDRRHPRARSRPGSRCAGCARCTCGVERAQANAAELARRLAEHPARRRGPLPRLRRDHVRSCSPAAATRPTC